MYCVYVWIRSAALFNLHLLVQMGIAVVNCTSGCTCEGKEIDGHHDILESQTHLSSVDVTQSKNCVLQGGCKRGT